MFGSNASQIGLKNNFINISRVNGGSDLLFISGIWQSKSFRDKLQVYQEEKLQVCKVCWLDLYLCEDVYDAVNIFNNKNTGHTKNW